MGMRNDLPPFMSRLVLVLLLAITSLSTYGEESFSFGVLMQRSPTLTAEYWNPILNYVTRRTGVQLNLKLATSGGQSGDAIRNGDYDFAYSNHQFKPSAIPQGYYVILRPRAPDIVGTLVVLADSPIRSVRDLSGKTVAFANPHGFTGYTVQMDNLARESIEVNPTFGGNQEGALAQLKAGSVSAAGVNTSILKEYAARENLNYHILWQSQPYHDLAISAHPRVPAKVVEAIKVAIDGMEDDPEGIKILEASAAVVKQKPPYGFRKASQNDYQAYQDFYRHNVFKGAD
jgi:phosphonate transport system substrate-binding protein